MLHRPEKTGNFERPRRGAFKCQTSPSMSKIIHITDEAKGHWHVYLTPIGADSEKGDEDEYIESFDTLAAAALALLEEMAKQDRERIEQNREEIAAYERHIEQQKGALLVSDCDWRKAEARASALARRQLALLYGEIEEKLEETGISFGALTQFHDAKETGY